MAKYGKHVVDLANGGIFARVVAKNFHFTKATREALERAHKSADDVLRRAPVKKPRNSYLGANPRKTSGTGHDVINRMPADKVRFWDPADPNRFKKVRIEASDGTWRPLKDFDMGHSPVDASSYWNNVGRYHGPRSPEVRTWMRSADNYELQLKGVNRSDGAALGGAGVRYQPPVTLPNGVKIDDLAPDILRDLRSFKVPSTP